MCAGCWARAGARASSRWLSGLAWPVMTRCTISSAARPGMTRRCGGGRPDKGNPRAGGGARQYCGELGKVANSQVLVTLTLARGEVPLPVGLRLFLPAAWTDDPGRCEEAGVPEAARTAQTKAEIALAEIDR